MLMRLCALMLLTAIGTPLLNATASAQAVGTWVSGLGDDVNPCSRTAPCQTFGGAISKTAAGGLITCMDAGAFGPVTITKSIAIVCDAVPGHIITGANGIDVKAAPGDAVYLSGLTIMGAPGASGNGINVISAASVHIANSTVLGFRAAGASGIFVETTSGPAMKVFIDNTTVAHNQIGINLGLKPTSALLSLTPTTSYRDNEVPEQAPPNARVR